MTKEPERYRFISGYLPQFDDPVGLKIEKRIREDLQIESGKIRTLRIIDCRLDFKEGEAEKIGHELFLDPVIEEEWTASTFEKANFKNVVGVSFLPGVTDNVARSAKEGIERMLHRRFPEEQLVYSSKLYLFEKELPQKELERIAYEVLHNTLIEKVEFCDLKKCMSGDFLIPPPLSHSEETPETETIPVCGLNDEALMSISKTRGLALSLEEMRAIQGYYESDVTAEARKKRGLSVEPTDLELEVMAQTWSEHCKHKIFAAEITYKDTEGERVIDSLFKSMISKPTKDMMKDRPDITSVFVDNAGVFHFDDELDVCVKVETHNSPSALDPYGGAMTGIVGVNRDILGTGRGFIPLMNTDIFCFGPPDLEEELPQGLMHPRRIFRGVHRGIVEGGNESGIPTVNGSIFFDNRFCGKPLVFCGTAGLAPRMIGDAPSHEKWIKPGDRVVMVGGRIGKDGIHGATFSSEGLTQSSPVSAVQIGDPITQKRLTDFMIVAREKGLYDFVTDNGAGGLSSSIGEMATACGGATIDLADAPLKYPGLAPWEIFLSEAQERMSFAVPSDRIEAFLECAKSMNVLAVDLGTFEDHGFLEIKYQGEMVALLQMEFLHEGNPRLILKAEHKPIEYKDIPDAELPELNVGLMHKLLSSPNIASKEDWVRQYDHEVKGKTVIKPFCGIERDGPSDAAVLKPNSKTNRGLAISHGMRPRMSDLDASIMAEHAVDEAIRSLVCVGASPDEAIGLDNFCWPDPLPGDRNPDAEHKLGQLVRACEGLERSCRAYRVPCISGKDSMKNDYVGEKVKISIPPTLLFTAVSPVPDILKAQSMDFKNPGDRIVLLGNTRDEMGASELYEVLGLQGGRALAVDLKANIERYRKVHQCMNEGMIESAHDCSDGGLITALLESCFAGRCGARINVKELSGDWHPTRFFCSESAGRILVSLREDQVDEFKSRFGNEEYLEIGSVIQDYVIETGQETWDLEPLFQSWRGGLKI